MTTALEKLFNNIRAFGLRSTITKIIEKIHFKLGIKNSKTLFLIKFYHSSDSINLHSEIGLNILTDDNVESFNKMKHFHFIETEKLIDNPSYKILTYLEENKIVGYVIFHIGEVHPIHGLGTWNLDKDEAWIGPAYVVKESRGKGINGILLQEAFFQLEKIGVSKIYTCINQSNLSSIRSFKKNGFKVIGSVTRSRKSITSKIFSEEKFANKFIPS